MGVSGGGLITEMIKKEEIKLTDKEIKIKENR
jgi:hypothetical protein